MNTLNNNENVYNPPEWKYIKGNQDIPVNQNSNNYNCFCYNNDGNWILVVHLPDECKAPEKPNAQFQNPIKSESENQTTEK